MVVFSPSRSERTATVFSSSSTFCPTNTEAQICTRSPAKIDLMFTRSTLRLHSRVGFHYNFRRVFLSVYRQLHVVSSRFNNGAEIEEAAEAAATSTTATAATKSRRQVGGTLRCLAAQVPLNAI